MTFGAGNGQTYEFHSTPHLYYGDDDHDLLVEIKEYGSDALEVIVTNKHLPRQRRAMKKRIILYLLVGAIYLSCRVQRLLHLACIDMLLLAWFALLLWQISRLIEFEKFLFCYDFGLQLQSKMFLGRSSYFIPCSKIHDICINEIIENLDFRYLLIVRTKGSLFRSNPIVPVFKMLKPSCDCLGLINKHLNKVMLRKPRDTSPSSQPQ